MGKLGRLSVFLEIVEEHFDELDFLWELREANLFTPDWTVREQGEHEERAEAHLDGLRISGLVGIDLACVRLTGGETFAATAATLVLEDSGEAEHLAVAFAALRAGDPAIADGIRIALRQGKPARFRDSLTAIAESADAIPAAAATDVLAFHRLAAPGLETLLASTDSQVRALAIGAAGRLGRLRESDLVAALEQPQSRLRRLALQEAARAGIPSLRQHCRRAATRGGEPDVEAIAFLGVVGDREDLSTLLDALTKPASAAAAIEGLGALGRVEGVPALLDAMSDAALGVAATVAYRRITAADDVEGVKAFPPPPVAEGEDEEEALPPDPEKARRDWQGRRQTMSTSYRWQWGIALDDTALPAAFEQLPLPYRRDVYLGLRSRKAAPDRELEAQVLVQARS